MKTFVLAAFIALIAAPVHAQGMTGGKRHHDSQSKSDAKPKANDAAYTNALTTLPDKRFDPWGEVRPVANEKPTR